ncbi:MAG: ADOP family duplicated permease [Gemmatimonadaceae bacterium]
MSTRPPGWRPAFRLPFGRRVEADVDEEIAFHLAMREERLRARGLAPEDARQKARERFGDLAQVRHELVRIDREQARRKRLSDTLEDIMQDVAFALRALRRAPGFAAAAVLTLALGIGSAAAIFTVAYGVLLRPLPLPDPERVAEISINVSGTGVAFGAMSAPEYVDLARDGRSFAAVGAWTPDDFTLGGDERPERVPGAGASASLFRVLGAPPAAGRYYTADEEAGDARVLVITHDLWRRRFNADPAAIGAKVTVDAVPRTLIGVLPPGVQVGGAKAFTPLGLDPAQLPERGAHFLRVLGRLGPSVSYARARDELAQFAARSVRENPSDYRAGGFTATARELREAMYGGARPLMLALLGTVLLLLLLASVNVANLLLVRAEARQREIGVRVALGAGRGRIVRQLLTESALLALLGALVGVPLAALGVRTLLAINPGVVPAGAEVALDGGVLAAVVAVVALAALVAGVAPAMRAGSTDVRTAIAAGSSGGGARGGRLRNLLVATEVALAAAMLVGAGLVGRSFQRLLAVDPGFEASGALLVDVALPRVKYRTGSEILSFYDRAVERLRALPGVQAAAATSLAAFQGGPAQVPVEIEGRPSSVTELETPYFVPSTTDVFRAHGIPVVRGRGFAPTDGSGAPPVAVISESMARTAWPGEDALGKRFRLAGDERWMTVVGIVRDVRPVSLSEPPRMTYYRVTSQFPWLGGMTLVVRTRGTRDGGSDPAKLTNAVRTAIHELDPDLALDNVRTLESVVTSSVARPRFAAAVLGAFGLSALALAVVGVYGVLSYAVTRRRRELAVRMALGARPDAVSRLVVSSGLKHAGAGVVIGLAAAVVGSRVLAALLYEVSPTDPATVVAVGAVLLGAALLASWLPARRATRVSPAEVLRGE